MAILVMLMGLLQDEKRDLKAVNEAMAKLKNYHYTLTVTVNDEKKAAFEGEWMGGDSIHSRWDGGEMARKGDVKLVKLKDGEWKEAKPGRKDDDPTMPHEWAARMAEHAGAIKREKSSKIGAVTVDLYVALPGGEAAKKAAEGGGLGLLPSLVDWTKSKNAILFSVGRDDLYRRVEQRFEVEGKEPKKGAIVMEFSELNAAKCRLPDEVRKKLKME
jgi:hypothetical protein